jgi:hypothetical protein
MRSGEMNFNILRKPLLVILPLMAALLLYGLALGSGIAEGPTKTGFIVYILIFSTLLIIEFVLLLKKKWLKTVSITSIATVLYLFGEYFEIFSLLDYFV